MSLYYQYIQGNVSKEELKQLTGVDVDAKEDFVEMRYLDTNGDPVGTWMVVTRFFTTGIVGEREIREIKK